MPDNIIEWPLRAVSTDPANATELDADGNILTDRNRLADSFVGTFVQTAGDTMTGQLIVNHSGLTPADGLIYIRGDTPAVTCESISSTATGGSIYRGRRARGTQEAPTTVLAGDRVFTISQLAARPDGTFRNAGAIRLDVLEDPLATENTIKTEWRLFVGDGSQQIGIIEAGHTRTFIGPALGVNFFNPTKTLEVGGTTMLRGTCEITGNITSSGTAHSFAANSIPASAVIGSVASTVASGLAPGASGAMVWDENFLYLRTATAWKKIPLNAI